MINLHHQQQQAHRHLWSDTVQRFFETLRISDRPAAGEISESLAVFCQGQDAVPAQGLSLLAARSFCATGDRETAEQILRQDRRHRAQAGLWLTLLSADTPFPELYPLFSAGALRPRQLASAGAVWVLDFDRVRLSEAERHELILFQTVRRLAERAYSVWKRSDGPGTLCVKGAGRLVRFLRPRGRRAADELLGHLRDVLAVQARRHGREAAPSILFLDVY